LTPEKAKEVIGGLKIDPPARITKLSMNWYEELSLTGLVTELADTQLFGIVEGAATGVTPRTGIFKQAAVGHDLQRPTNAALITGGVVFLDEIGDLPPALQPKLLTVLTGAEIAPVGGESKTESHYSFTGLTLAATWKDPISNELLRRDLLSRLSDHILRVPSLDQRAEDLEVMVESIVSEIRRGRTEWLKGRERLKGVGFDLERAQRRKTDLEAYVITADDLRTIRTTDWGEYGDLRGLSQVLRRSIEQGIRISQSLKHQLHMPTQVVRIDAASDVLFQRLMDIAANGQGLSGLVQAVERGIRAEFVADLRVHPSKLSQLARHLDIDERELRRSLADVVRDRRMR
jgi:transcriptional regulator with GAF, ATPase, and Fis domain